MQFFLNLTANLFLEACAFLLQETSNWISPLKWHQLLVFRFVKVWPGMELDKSLTENYYLKYSDDWHGLWTGPVITIHQCVSLMSHDVTTRDWKLGPGNCDLALHIAPSPTIKLGPNYYESLWTGHKKEEAISIHPKHWYIKYIEYTLYLNFLRLEEMDGVSILNLELSDFWSG